MSFPRNIFCSTAPKRIFTSSDQLVDVLGVDDALASQLFDGCNQLEEEEEESSDTRLVLQRNGACACVVGWGGECAYMYGLMGEFGCTGCCARPAVW
eukprot:SAG11_NODE_585_length_8349_cov_38.121939_4_plen_97_part_00